MGFGSFMEVLSVFLAPSDASHKTVSAIYQQFWRLERFTKIVSKIDCS